MSETAATVVRILLVLDLLGLVVLAGFYLRTRRLTWKGYLGWGLLALLLPILGPYLVIVLHPGRRADQPLTLSQKVRQRHERQAYALDLDLQVHTKDRE